MIPAAFRYVRATTIDDALTATSRGPDAKLLAGGQSLVPQLRSRSTRADTVIDISRIPALRGIEVHRGEDKDELVIGAATTHAELSRSPVVLDRAPLLAEAAARIGDPQVRACGTIGGSLAYGHPTADLTTACTLYGARVDVHSFQEPVVGVLVERVPEYIDTGGLIGAVTIPCPSQRHGWSYQRFTARAESWAIVAAAVLVDETSATVVVSGLSPTPQGWPELAAIAHAPENEIGELVRGTFQQRETSASEFRVAIAATMVERGLKAAREDLRRKDGR